MSRFGSILIAVDFSPSSDAALRQALRIAEWNRASLAALHVVSLPAYVPVPHPFLPLDVRVEEDLIADARRRWERFVPEAVRSALDLQIEVGSPRDRIVERVREDGVDLLVMGANSQSGAEGAGSTAAGCIQRARAMVMLVRAGQDGPFRSVVACIDFTETSRLALEQAIRIATEDDAALDILHVYEDPWARPGEPDAIRLNMPDFRERYAEAVASRLREFCAPLAHEIGALKARFHTLQSAGPGRGISEFIGREGCELAVLGTRAAWNFRDAFLGSTAERVVRRAPCSVLTVKPPGFGGASGTAAPGIT